MVVFNPFLQRRLQCFHCINAYIVLRLKGSHHPKVTMGGSDAGEDQSLVLMDSKGDGDEHSSKWQYCMTDSRLLYTGMLDRHKVTWEGEK